MPTAAVWTGPSVSWSVNWPATRQSPGWEIVRPASSSVCGVVSSDTRVLLSASSAWAHVLRRGLQAQEDRDREVEPTLAEAGAARQEVGGPGDALGEVAHTRPLSAEVGELLRPRVEATEAGRRVDPHRQGVGRDRAG